VEIRYVKVIETIPMMKFDYNNSFNGIVDDTSELLSDVIYNIILYKYKY